MSGKYLTLKEIEGVVVHDIYLKKEVARRVEAFEYLGDVQKMAEFIGGDWIVPPSLRCDWMIKKVFFPGVECCILFNRKDDELPASMQVLFTGEEVHLLQGDDLASMVISTINHMIRYIKRSNPEKSLPEICDLV